MQDNLEISNGTEVSFGTIDSTFTVIRTIKDNWGNEMGQLLVNKNGKEFELREMNGGIKLAEANAVVHNPKPVGEITELGASEWFEYGVGEYKITA